MLRILFAFTTCWTTNVYAQQYSYSFSGSLENRTELEAKILQIEGINSCKVRVKEEKSSGGEILLDIAPYAKQEDNKNPDTFIQLKRIVSEAGLDPGELTEIKTN